MKLLRSLVLPLLFLGLLAARSVAAEADPSGRWEWTVHGPQGPLTITADLRWAHGALTGTVTARGNPAEISAASFADGVVKFTVVRGADYHVHYQGQLAGDTLTGTMDRPGPEGRDVIAWQAKRVR